MVAKIIALSTQYVYFLFSILHMFCEYLIHFWCYKHPSKDSMLYSKIIYQAHQMGVEFNQVYLATPSEGRKRSKGIS